MSQASFIPDGPSFGQSDVSLVRSADLLWTDVRCQAPMMLSKASPRAKGHGIMLGESTVEAGIVLIAK